MEFNIKRRTFPKFSIIAAWVALILLCVFLVKGLLSGFRFMRMTGLTPMLAVRLAVDNGVTLKSSSDRTNILVLGIGGGTHEGADLTDTMMVVSLDAQKKSVALISIPRDTWSDTLKDRINSAYHYGEAKSRSAGKKGGGLLLARVIAEDVVGMPIHYSFLVDFSGFKDIIDLLGGIDVDVSKGFTDNDYPIEGREKDTCPDDPTNRCVYEIVRFDAGIQRMDGERALKYVRSRHADGVEGGDFSRSRRQQDVLVALKDTLVHPLRWFSFERAGRLRTVVDQATDTDMNLGELATVAKRVAGIQNDQIQRISFDDLLYNPPAYLYGRYVLIPKEDWETIHEFIAGELAP